MDRRRVRQCRDGNRLSLGAARFALIRREGRFGSNSALPNAALVRLRCIRYRPDSRPDPASAGRGRDGPIAAIRPSFCNLAGELSVGRAEGPAFFRSSVDADGRRRSAGHSTLAPENLTTLAHFSASSAISFPKASGEPGSTVPPSAASRAFSLGSASPALTSLFSLLTISADVVFGAAMPGARCNQEESHRALSPLIFEHDLVRKVCNFSGSCFSVRAICGS
jgi:hypothetical protein